MTLTPLGPGLTVVEHQGHQCTFVSATFAEMLDWCYGIQHLGRSFHH